MAAHWFQFPTFYPSAAQALRPGGTLALWITSPCYCHPSVPGCREIQTFLHTLEDELLGPYMMPGNRLARQCYDDLPLPWSSLPSPSATTMTGGEGAENPCAALFDEVALERKYWDRGGVTFGTSLLCLMALRDRFLLGREVGFAWWLEGS
ncbi:hypothetical protein KC332_g6510 [Hortaea werneckii]|nr:hypothetical protein KC358_g6229 [Hortaea werneckii]OTA24717.1 hypothetical protein BTJ68_11628 [Hortaea werneckii EXF-2000]KAI6839630.1 hypothetical protein KC350_g5612 [Hortaea werneckii]KAI6934448.1 hypothetical protein KC348_g6501 [Hortaea werneckii]KAI6936787.1 hypothetical protein KC341_g6026 [Hortaea werneckii]